MQVDAGYFHDAEHARQDQGNTAGYDEARPQAQTQEADGQYDEDSFTESIDEVVDGFLDDLRLVRYLMELHTGW
ncbi:Uncharacterised protein [uncultured Ruminococcus sp.]|nr:Uncharacterised protein [uncultured Ruminococcus sp.]